MTKELSFGYIARFWLPLAATWLMMAAEGPILTSMVARMEHKEFNLAAYGVAFAIAMFIEAPIIMMLSAAIAIVRDAVSYRRLRNFTTILNAAITLLMIAACSPWVFSFVTTKLVPLDPEISWRTHQALIVLIPWPAAIGFRRFWQGVMIKNHETSKVAIGTTVRLVSMILVSTILFAIGGIEGVVIGAAGLTTGVVFEALATRYLATSSIRVFCSVSGSATPHLPMSYRAIGLFYLPLGLTSLIGMGATPILSSFLTRCQMVIMSQAALPVVDGFVFLFRSFGFSYQEAAMALIGRSRENHRKVRDFALIVGVLTTGALGLIAFSPALDWIYLNVWSLTKELADFAVWPTRALVLLPFIAVFYSLQRAMILNAHLNHVVTISTGIELLSMVAVFLVWLGVGNPVGIEAAAVSMIVARIVAMLYQFPHYRKALRQSQKAS